MKTIFLSLVLFFTTLVSFNKLISQHCEVVPFDYPQFNELDWRSTDFYVAHLTTPQTPGEIDQIIIPSPYIGGQQFQENIVHLIDFEGDVQDYEPEDGWVLVMKKFGTPTEGVRFPTFVLYNRYQSKLRIFSWLVDPDGYDEVAMRFKFANTFEGSYYVSAALSNLVTPSPVIENYESDDETSVIPNVFYSQAGLWVMGDVIVSYDPCTCEHSSKFLTDLLLYSSQDLNFTLEGGGVIDQIISSGSTSSSPKGFGLSDISPGVKKGYSFYKKLEKFQSDSKKRLAALANKKKSTVGSANGSQVPTLMLNLGYGNTFNDLDIGDLLQNASAGSADHKKLAKEVLPINKEKLIPDFLKKILPYAGTTLQFLDLFIGGGSSGPNPMHFRTKLNFVGTGNLDNIDPGPKFGFYTPGSNETGWNSINDIPYYDNLMGIINVMEKPVLYKAEAITNTESGGYGYLIEHSSSYKLAEGIKYALNPAAGLSIKEIQGAFVYDVNASVRSSANITGNDINEFGLIPVEDYTWRTPYMPLSCLENYVVNTVKNETGSANGSHTNFSGFYVPEDGTDILFELKVILERTDGGANSEEVSVNMVFPVEVVNAPYSYENTPPNPYIGIQENVEVATFDEVMENDIRAWGQIELTEESVVGNWPLITLAELVGLEGESVLVTPEDGGIPYYTIEYNDRNFIRGDVLSAGTILYNQPSCISVLPVDSDYLNSFCSDQNRYDPVAFRGAQNEGDPGDDGNLELEEIVVFPNPASDYLNVRLVIYSQEEEVTIRVVNPMGQDIGIFLKDQILEKGIQTLSFPLEKLASGMYTIHISKGGLVKNVPFVKN